MTTFTVTINLPTGLHTVDEVEDAVKDGLNRLCIRSYREHTGRGQSWPNAGTLAAYNDVEAEIAR